MKAFRFGPEDVSATVRGVFVALLFGWASSQSLAVTLIMDDFSDGDRFKTGATDADWLHYNMNGGSGPTSGYVSVVPDATAQIGSGDALEHGPVDRAAVAQFSSVTLANDGDYIALSFDFRVASGFAYANGFRYSLFDIGSSVQTDSGNESDSGVGYGGIFGTHAAGGVFGPVGGNNPFTSAGGGIAVTALDVADGNVHQLALTLTKAGTDIGAVLTVDSVEVGNGVMGASAGFAFNALGLYNADAWSSPPASMYFDNVVVKTSVVPEPSSIALAGLAGLLLAACLAGKGN